MDKQDSGPKLSHLDASGEVHMVDVGNKHVTARVAEARGVVTMQPETLSHIKNATTKKGDVLAVARVAGILAAKKTSELIPLCHALSLTSVEVEFTLDKYENQVEVMARARTDARTGVEMEALTAVSIAALTIYDMCKSVDRSMRIENIRLTLKTGGKSGTFRDD